MSIRTALVGGISVLLLVSIGVVAFIGTRTIRTSVVREAQMRVDHDLDVLVSLYETEMSLTLERLTSVVGRSTAPSDTDFGSVLRDIRRDFGFPVLNLVRESGKPWAGSQTNVHQAVPVASDPVLRSALEGKPSQGTVLLEPERLRLEGGAALTTSLRLLRSEGETELTPKGALFQWYAVPVADSTGRVSGAVYGGRPINHDHALVDRLAETLFGAETFEGKPLGTVTLFLDDVRAATNVRDSEGTRAIGTRVSDVVRRHVIEAEKRWRDRAWVVDAWYLSAYQPLTDPTGRTIGMFYVGLLEEPYDAEQARMVRGFILPSALLLGLALALSVFVVRRITHPLQALQDGARRLAEGEWSESIRAKSSFREIDELTSTMNRMQSAIETRDRDLRNKNDELTQTNDRVEKANRNYMSTLGFVTHELKGPLANIQSLIELVVDGYTGEVSEKSRETLTRIRRNCEELQIMVKNYLDLSRAERDELTPTPRDIDLISDVVEPCVEQVRGLYGSRRIRLETELPKSRPVSGDPELLRIALTNFLNNAAKYGREGGRARLTVREDGTRTTVEVWNEGNGFILEEGELLFGKFTRLKNKATKSSKGSGLGLYLTRTIIESHGGRVWAKSDPGVSATFGFALPM